MTDKIGRIARAIYIRKLEDGQYIPFCTNPEEDERRVPDIMEMFNRLTGYFRFNKSSIELALLVPEEVYSPYSSILATRDGILVSRAHIESARAHLVELNSLKDLEDVHSVLYNTELDRRFELPDINLSPLFSYELGPNENKIRIHRKGKKIKELDAGNLFQYFFPAIAASMDIYPHYKTPIVCRVEEYNREKLMEGPIAGHVTSTDYDYYSVLNYDKGVPYGTVYYTDFGGMSLKDAVKQRKRL